MNNFHFAKIITGVAPTLAKETVLSKVINMVDVFRMSLSGGFDDNNKKYIDTIMKLDNSKTIMLELKGTDLRVKNVMNIKLKEKQIIQVEYSEYAQESNKKIFIDAPFLSDLKTGQIIKFQQSGVSVKVKNIKEENITCEVIQSGELIQFDKATFKDYDLNLPFLTDKDKKDILWGLEYGIHIISAPNIKSKEDIFVLKEFLASQNVDKMKVIAKIETKEALDNFEGILQISDGIIFAFDKIEKYMKDKKIIDEKLMKKCKDLGKPIIITVNGNFVKGKYQHINESVIKRFCGLTVDAYMIETILKEEESLDIVTELSDTLDKNELKIHDQHLNKFFEKNEDFVVRDYIIYNAYRATKEIEIRAIVSYTENGYTTARLSSLNPTIPLISFTKNDETYRFLNMLRGVKGYKISQSFSYENLKRIGKEMIRIIFKGNISLDDKILIVQANEMIKDEKTGMINGLELYKFKNI